MTEIYDINKHFDLSHTLLNEFIKKENNVINIISKLKEEVIKLGNTLSLDEYDKLKSDVWISKSAKVAFTSTIQAPAIIGHNSEIRPGAYIRGGVIIGNNCVIGNSTEIKNSILFDNVQVPHFNYVGDSILGYKAHLGAGVILSNVRLDKKDIMIKIDDRLINSKMRKLGSIIGDEVEIGCNSVVCPGTLIEKKVKILPLNLVKGKLKEGSVYNKKG